MSNVDNRAKEAAQIKAAYAEVDRALARVGKLLRTTDAGRFMWSSSHKTCVTGLRGLVEKLRRDVPDYRGS